MLFELCPIFLFWSLDSLDGGLKPEINTQMLSQFDNKKRSEPVDSHWCCKYFNKLYNSSLTSLCPISCHIFSAGYPKKYRIGSRCGPFVHTSTSSFLNESTSPPGSVVLTFKGMRVDLDLCGTWPCCQLYLCISHYQTMETTVDSHQYRKRSDLYIPYDKRQ